MYHVMMCHASCNSGGRAVTEEGITVDLQPDSMLFALLPRVIVLRQHLSES